ncbi:MAG: hypothetical protein COA91_03285 [Robiginitomaculum sp.]|nr:MAG: hypothetical protein COA91_03285 [Robiginitomaculum sp.]
MVYMTEKLIKNPKTFISYSWSSPEYENRIIKLAEDLMSEGVEVILDKWHLRDGHDANAFMEKMVNDPEITKVIIACDKAYQSKADKRKGGVGTEAQIISSKLYSEQEQDKFVAVIFERDEAGEACTPTYYTSRIYIDFTNIEEESLQFERLVRWIYDKPVHVPPPLGKVPKYITDGDIAAKISTSVKYKRAIEAIKTNKPYFVASLSEYFEELIAGLEHFRPDTNFDPFDDAVIKMIENFIPYRNEIINLFEALAKFSPDMSYLDETIKFLESFYKFTDRPENISRFRDWDWDVFKFLHHEVFLYIIAVLIKRGNFIEAETLINGGYYISLANQQPSLEDISVFRPYLTSLESRKSRLKLRRISLHADLLKERCVGINLSFADLMQADFVLYIARYIHVNDSRRIPWYPITLLYASYHHTGFEIFIRAETDVGFKKLQTLLGIEGIEKIDNLITRIKSGEVKQPSYDHETISVPHFLNYEKLGIRNK